MAHINFLEPPRFTFRQLDFRHFELNYLWMMVIAGALLVLMPVYGMVQRYRVSSLNEALVAAAAEAKKAAGLTPAAPGAPHKPTLMESLQLRVAWSPVLNAIANKTPDTVSLNFIKGNAAGARGMQLEGLSADVLSAARYKDALADMPFFSRVALKSSVEKVLEASTADKSGKSGDKTAARPAAGGRSRLTFEIQGWLK